MTPRPDALRQYVEDFTLIFEQTGAPRTAARVLAYLQVCDPPHQTMNDLMDALQLSKSSVSSATQTLIQYRLVQRISIPGKRRDYYRVESDVWNTLIYRRVEEARQMREMAERGLHLLENSPDSQKDRLEGMYHFYKFIEKEMPKLVERWEAENSDKS